MADEVLQGVIEIRNLAREGLEDFRRDSRETREFFERQFSEIRESVERTEDAIEDAARGSRSFFSTVTSLASRAANVVTGFATAFLAVQSALRSIVSVISTGFRAGFRFVEQTLRTSINLAQAFLQELDEIGGGLDRAAKISQRFGVSIDAYRELSFAAKQAGLEQRTFELALQRMTRRLGEVARMGRGEALPAIEALGLTIDEFAGLEPDQQFEKLAGALSEVRDESERLALGFKFFDTEGAAVLQLVDLGVPAIRSLRREFRDLNSSLSELQIGEVTRLRDEISAIQTAFRGLKEQIVVDIAPALADLAGSLRDAFVRNRPEIVGVIRGIPAAARVAFEFIRDNGAFVFGQLSKAILEVLAFTFESGADLMVAAFDGGLAILEDRFKTRFERIRNLGRAIFPSLFPETEFERIQRVLGQVESTVDEIARSTNFTGPGSGVVGPGGPSQGSAAAAARRMPVVAIDDEGTRRAFRVIRDEHGRTVQLIEQATGTATAEVIEVVRNAEGQIKQFVSSVSGEIGAGLGGQLGSIGERLRVSVGENLDEMLAGLREIGREAGASGKSIEGAWMDIRDAIDAAVARERAIADALGIMDAHIALMNEEWRDFDETAGRIAEKTLEIKRNVLETPAPGEGGGTRPVRQQGTTFAEGVAEGAGQVREEFSAFNRGVSLVQESVNGLANTLENSLFNAAVNGFRRMSDAAKAFGRDLLRLTAQILLRQAIGAIVGQVFGGGGQQVKQGGETFELQPGTYTPVGEAARGGMFAGPMRPIGHPHPMPLKRMAAGGLNIVDRPTLFEVGDGDRAEAIVPLPDNRSIPVSLRMEQRRAPQTSGRDAQPITVQDNSQVSVVVHVPASPSMAGGSRKAIARAVGEEVRLVISQERSVQRLIQQVAGNAR